MHSQLMFNECIAKTRSREREGSVHIIHSIHDSVSIVDICVCSRVFRVEGGFNILPSSGLGEGRAGHQIASSSEALRRT